MALAPISNSNVNLATQPRVDRTHDEVELNRGRDEQENLNQNAPVQAQDSQTTAQPVAPTAQTERSENNTRLEQQANDRASQQNSADNNLGSQLDVTV